MPRGGWTVGGALSSLITGRGSGGVLDSPLSHTRVASAPAAFSPAWRGYSVEANRIAWELCV
jgi:hypothetical protein